MTDSIFEATPTHKADSGIPYPNIPARKLLRLPIWLYRTGLGGLLNRFHIMLLTTEGRKSGLPRHTAIEYRAHGSKIYVVSAWGERSDWYRNLLVNPTVSLRQGERSLSAQAHPVTDTGEALRVLNLFRKTAPAWYDALLTQLSTEQNVNRMNLPNISSEFTIVRFEPLSDHLVLPVVPTDRRWVWLVGLSLVLFLMFVRRTKA